MKMKGKTMKMHFLILLSLIAGYSAHAQQKTQGEVTETIDLYVHPDAKNHATLSQIKKADSEVDLEKKEIKRLQENNPDDCDKQDLALREQDVNFYDKHKEQIDEIIGTIRKGLKVQLGLLQGYTKGEVTGFPSETITTPDGKTQQSAVISYNDTDESGKTTARNISVSDLIAYIRKFEAEAKTVSDDQKDIDAFVAKYKDPKTQNDPKYFYMTLDQAVKAYAGCAGNGGCLNSAFQVSYHEEQGRVLVTGSGKHMFRITTTTVLDWNQKYGTTVSTQLRDKNSAQTKVAVNMVQDFGEAMDLAAEGAYWKILRNQQLTIDGVPIDGYLRKIYFDMQRSNDCQKKKGFFTYNADSTPGPYLSYSEKTECKKFGLDILTGSVTKTYSYGGTAPVGAVFDITKYIQDNANGKGDFSSDFYAAVSSQGMGHCDDVRLRITYVCGCDREEKVFENVYKMGHPQTISCPNR